MWKFNEWNEAGSDIQAHTFTCIDRTSPWELWWVIVSIDNADLDRTGAWQCVITIIHSLNDKRVAVPDLVVHLEIRHDDTRVWWVNYEGSVEVTLYDVVPDVAVWTGAISIGGNHLGIK